MDPKVITDRELLEMEFSKAEINEIRKIFQQNSTFCRKITKKLFKSEK